MTCTGATNRARLRCTSWRARKPISRCSVCSRRAPTSCATMPPWRAPCVSCARPICSRRSGSDRCPRKRCASSSTHTHPVRAASDSAWTAAATRCSRSSSHAPKSRATVVRRSASSCRSGSRVLHGDDGDVLRWAAVLAPRIDAETLSRVTGVDWNRIGEVLESAARRSMLQPAGQGFRFSHELIARSIYGSISPARRRTMHRRVAELLERDSALDAERAADLAHHAAQSGDPALAARAMVSAGKLCLRFFANDEALSARPQGLVSGPSSCHPPRASA